MASRNPVRQELAPQHHIARYCRGRHIAPDGKVLGAAFLLRDGEEYLSTNWLEHFHPTDRQVQLAAVLQTLREKGRRVARTGCLSVLNVGMAIDRCRQGANLEIRFIRLGERQDPSHTGIYGLTENKSRAADLLAQSIPPSEIHPAG